MCAQLFLDGARRPISVDTLKAVVLLHGFEFLLNQALIFDKAGVHIG